MQFGSILAIYALFWVLSAFLVMPFGLRTPDQVEGHRIETGHADSAPVNFQPGRIALRATILSALIMGLFYLNYLYGWVDVSDLNLFQAPKVQDMGY
jgi:predicted secreted protein